jgi:hypothetical protein
MKKRCRMQVDGNEWKKYEEKNKKIKETKRKTMCNFVQKNLRSEKKNDDDRAWRNEKKNVI